jgi:two-component system chemotaxis sensor kinase CheA
VTFSRTPESNQLQVICRDDGAGLNADAIRNRAVGEGLVKEAEGRALSEQEIYTLIFEPGFSTVSDAHEDGGRGVGLDVVREEIVNQLNGNIHIEFAANQFCEFGLTIPTA